jgi:hypothetical protein
MQQAQAQVETYGEIEHELGKILPVYNVKSFCARVISSVKIAMTYREDIDQHDERRKASGVITNDCHSKVNPEELARKWNIGRDTAKKTLDVTTQEGIRTVVHPMTRRLRVHHLNLHQPRLTGTWHVNTLFAKVKSKRCNTCANVYTQGKFTRVIPMTSRKDAGKSLVEFTDDVGIPDQLVTDGAMEFTGKNTDFVKEARRMRICLHTAKQGRKNQNHAAEREIGTLAKRWKLRMTKKDIPKRLWDFGLVYESEILSRTARGTDSRTGYEEVTGQTPDISEWTDFEFYDLVWWLDRPVKPDMTDYVRRLARWLGVSHWVGSDLCYWLITDTGKIISKLSVEHVVRDDYLQEGTKKMIDDFNTALLETLNNENFTLDGDGEFNSINLDDLADEYDQNPGVAYDKGIEPSLEDYADMIVEDRPEDDDEDAVNKFLNAELIFGVGTNDERRGRVVKRSRGLDGKPIGCAHSNVLFDFREYEVKFTDGSQEKYQANVIAENLYAQVDDEGRQFSVLEEIVDHSKDNMAVPISEGTVRSANGTEKAKVTTRGWKLLCRFKDGSMDWVKLKDLNARHHKGAARLPEPLRRGCPQASG